MVSYIYISVHVSLVQDLFMFKSQLHFLFSYISFTHLMVFFLLVCRSSFYVFIYIGI